MIWRSFQNAPLSPEAMTKFVARSNDIMLLLAKIKAQAVKKGVRK